MKTLIVPTDFSAVADNAASYAFDMARSIGANLLFLHVYNLPVAVSEIPVVVIPEDDIRKNAEEKLEELKNRYNAKQNGDIQITTKAILGVLEDELRTLCTDSAPLAVVMATSGPNALERLLFGSNTIIAMKRLIAPVIIVPAGTKYHAVKKIGFACDLKNVMESTPAEEIKSLVSNFNAELHVLNIDHDNKHYTLEAQQEVANLGALLSDVSPAFHYVENESVEDGINSFVDKNNIDLLIIIPKKHSLIDSIFQKSLSKEMVMRTHVPMVAIHEE